MFGNVLENILDASFRILVNILSKVPGFVILLYLFLAQYHIDRPR